LLTFASSYYLEEIKAPKAVGPRLQNLGPNQRTHRSGRSKDQRTRDYLSSLRAAQARAEDIYIAERKISKRSRKGKKRILTRADRRQEKQDIYDLESWGVYVPKITDIPKSLIHREDELSPEDSISQVFQEELRNMSRAERLEIFSQTVNMKLKESYKGRINLMPAIMMSIESRMGPDDRDFPDVSILEIVEEWFGVFPGFQPGSDLPSFLLRDAGLWGLRREIVIGGWKLPGTAHRRG
jgi:hypothetical protein